MRFFLKSLKIELLSRHSEKVKATVVRNLHPISQLFAALAATVARFDPHQYTYRASVYKDATYRCFLSKIYKPHGRYITKYIKGNIIFSTIILCMLLASNTLIAQDFKTVGYFPTYRFSLVDDVAFDKLTHLNIAFARPNEQGHLTTNGIPIVDVVQKAQAVGLEVYISLAGGAASLSVWENWLAPANRSFFISKIIEYVKAHNLQGVDVDLEWGTVNDDYSGFVLELRDSLKTYNYGITAALPGTYRYPEVSDEALAAYDWVNLMVYDLTGPWAPNQHGPHSPFSFAESAIIYWQAQGLSREKMTLGVPFYGYDFTNLEKTVSVKFSDMVSKNTNYAYRDQVGRIYYNGIYTIAEKTRLAMQENLGGMMIWELGQDDFGEFSLLNTISQSVNGAIITSLSEMEITASIENPYPNPVSDVVNLDFPQSTDFELSLYSPISTEVLTIRHSNRNNISLDMKDYTPGIYFITLKTEALVKTFRIQKI